jgi:hypothetical protein
MEDAVSALVFALSVSLGGVVVPEQGTLRGIVVNGSKSNSPAAGAEVVLQVEQDGVFVPVAQAASDERGEFLFSDLPLDDAGQFRAGASHEGVYYPGPRVRIHRDRPHASVQLVVYGTITTSSPLIARRHEFVVRGEAGALLVIETMLISNPQPGTWVGRSTGAGAPVTLRLAVPSDFQKVTFHKEFYGRRFMVHNSQLVTNIPWPPGDRELTFTYVVPRSGRQGLWSRSLDLPCSDVRVTVVSDGKGKIRCNLPRAPDGRAGAATYLSSDTTLPAGHRIELVWGQGPVPFMATARWVALAVLGVLTLVLVLVVGRRTPMSRRLVVPFARPVPTVLR